MLPRVENPIPETIGLGTIISAAGAGGTLLFVLATMLRLSKAEREAWSQYGMAAGFLVGAISYLIALVAQIL